MFMDLVKLDSNILIEKLKGFSLDKIEDDVKKETSQENRDLSQACQLFIRNFCEEVLIRYCVKAQEVSKKQPKSKTTE